MASSTVIRSFPYAKQYVRCISPPPPSSPTLSAGTLREIVKPDFSILRSGDDLILRDRSGNRLIRMKRVKYGIRSKYKLVSEEPEEHQRCIAVIRRSGLLSRKLVVKSIHGKYFVDKSNDSAIRFTLRKQGEVVATITRDEQPKGLTVNTEFKETEDKNFMLLLIHILRASSLSPQ